MMRYFLPIVLTIGVAAAAAADCADFKTWAEQAGLGQSAPAAPTWQPVGAQGAPDCGRSLTMAGVASVHCAWGFDFRAEASVAAFDSLRAQIAACYPPRVAKKSRVNHPDSYDLQQFEIEGGSLSLSLKDKGALQQSFVFLRAAVRP